MIFRSSASGYYCERIEDLWTGLSRLFEAFFYSRPHQLKSEQLMQLHVELDANAVQCFRSLLKSVSEMADK